MAGPALFSVLIMPDGLLRLFFSDGAFENSAEGSVVK